MNKRFLCALSCLGLMFSLSACNNNDTQEQQGYPALFELKRESATLDLFSSLQLETVDEIDGTIIYSSDNESIASVDINGVVHTHSTEGQANISATYG